MKKRLFTFTWIALLITGLSLLIWPLVEDSMIQHLVNQANTAKITQQNTNSDSTNFKFSKIKSITSKDVATAIFTSKSKNIIGRISIPSVQIKLPLYYGLNNKELLSGAGTMKPKQTMGHGNYVIAGHHMNDEKTLLGPLNKVHLNSDVYLTDGKKLYVYQIYNIKKINEYQIHYVTDTYHKPTLTIITCASGEINEPNRTLVRAHLIMTQPISKESINYFK
jgi:sortase A